MGSFPETYINPLFLDQFKAWIYRKRFPERSAKFYSVLSRENILLSCSLGVSPLQYSEARFSKVSTTFRARKALLCLPCLHEIKVSIILKMTQWNYQLTKQNWPVCERGTLLLFNCFWFRNLPSDPRSCRDFRETGPCIVCFEAVEWGRFKQSITLNERTLKELYFNYNLFK